MRNRAAKRTPHNTRTEVATRLSPNAGCETSPRSAVTDRPLSSLLGASSEITPPGVVRRRLAEVLPAAVVEVVPSAGHSLPVEHPKDVGAHIDAFPRGVESRG
jgi:pimeloyl-ACP methyl ester carboxylesterase